MNELSDCEDMLNLIKFQEIYFIRALKTCVNLTMIFNSKNNHQRENDGKLGGF